MKIAVGTTSEQKLGYLQEILDELKIEAELASFDVASKISEQPMSSKETKTGSINRARNALSCCDGADMAIGIEIGYHPNTKGDYKMLCWATIVNGDGKKVSAMSHKLLMPQFHQQILKQDKYLGEYVRQFLAENPDHLSQEIGEILRNRKPFIQTALRSSLLEYFLNDK